MTGQNINPLALKSNLEEGSEEWQLIQLLVVQETQFNTNFILLFLIIFIKNVSTHKKCCFTFKSIVSILNLVTFCCCCCSFGWCVFDKNKNKQHRYHQNYEPHHRLNWNSLAVLSEVLLDDIQSLGFLTEVLDDDNGTAANLTGLALLVDLAQTRPFTQFLVRIDTDQGNLMFVTKGSNELLVVGFVKRLSQDTQRGLTPGKTKIK